MKLSSKTKVTVSNNSGSYRTLAPDTYIAHIKGVSIKEFKMRASHPDDYNRKLKNPETGNDKWLYKAIVPDTLIVDGSNQPVIINRENYIIGAFDKEGDLIHPANVTGVSEGQNPLWFGASGAGSWLVAMGVLTSEGEFTDIDITKIAEVVVKVRTDVAGFVPSTNNTASINYSPEELRNVLKELNGGEDYDFDMLNVLQLRYNLREGYTEVHDKDAGVIWNAESEIEGLTKEIYNDIMEGYRNRQITFVDLIEGEGDNPSSVRLKTKTVITGVYKLSEFEADSGDYHHDRDTGVTYLTKASQVALESAVEADDDEPEAVGW